MHLSLVMSLWLAAAPSQDPPLRLADLLAQARTQNPEIRAARAQAESLRAGIGPAGAWDDPMLMVQLWNQPVDFSMVPLMVQLSQTVPLGGKRRLREDSARAAWEAAQADAAEKVREIEERVTHTYFDLFTDERAIAIDGELLQTVREMEAVAATRVASGRGEQVDQLRAQAELLKVQADLETVTADRISAQARLTALLDRRAGAPYPPTAAPQLLERLPGLDELQQRALQARPELTAARAMVASAQSELGLAKADQVPDLGLSLGWMHAFHATGQADFLFAGFQGNLPVFWGSKNGPRIQAAHWRVEAMEDTERALEDAVLSEVADALAQLTAEDRLVQLHHKLIPVAIQTLKSALSSYTAGRTSFLMVLDSERELQAHDLDLAMHLARYEQRLAELQRAVGAPVAIPGAGQPRPMDHEMGEAP